MTLTHHVLYTYLLQCKPPSQIFWYYIYVGCYIPKKKCICITMLMEVKVYGWAKQHAYNILFTTFHQNLIIITNNIVIIPNLRECNVNTWKYIFTQPIPLFLIIFFLDYFPTATITIYDTTPTCTCINLRMIWCECTPRTCIWIVLCIW